jgi:hypothetical protein
MGDRGNIAVKQSNGQVWFYGHWSGYRLKNAVQDALKKRERWTDQSYLARIIFDQFTPAKDHGVVTTGFGISTSITDNEHDIVVVDIPNQRVFTIPEAKLTKEGRVPEKYVPAKDEVWSFEEFCNLTLKTEE